MEKGERRTGRAFTVWACISLISIGFILVSVLIYESKDSEAASVEGVSRSIDRGGAITFLNEDKASRNS